MSCVHDGLPCRRQLCRTVRARARGSGSKRCVGFAKKAVNSLVHPTLAFHGSASAGFGRTNPASLSGTGIANALAGERHSAAVTEAIARTGGNDSPGAAEVLGR